MQESPVPIVAKAEAELLLASGQKLLAELKPLVRKAYEKTGEYKLLRMEICRRACALSLDPRAKADAAKHYELQQLKDGKPGGRPSSVHGLFFKDLASATKLDPSALRHWLSEWNQFAGALGISLDEQEEVRVGETPLQTLYEGFCETFTEPPPPTVSGWIEHVLGSAESTPIPREPPVPEAVASQFVTQVEKFFVRKGTPVLRTPAQKHAFAKECNKLFGKIGLPWEFLPRQR